jgi:hypothetical protein
VGDVGCEGDLRGSVHIAELGKLLFDVLQAVGVGRVVMAQTDNEHTTSVGVSILLTSMTVLAVLGADGLWG